MSPILEKTLDQVEHITSELNVTITEESLKEEANLDVSTGLGLRGGMEDGHTNPDQGEGPSRRQRNKEALQSLDIDDVIRSLILSQIREASVLDGVDGCLMDLLQKCLETDHERSFIVALSGYIEHFESKLEEDLGWGCGWRNIQMLSSYMLAQNPEVKDVLFGGAGFVPDIPAIQQWLEIAWLKGFDVLGADYFDWKISGTQKWIGTTECAALLRSFGVRARIIDFRTVSSKRGMEGLRGTGGSDIEPSYDSAGQEELVGNLERMTVSGSGSGRYCCHKDPTLDDNDLPDELPSVVVLNPSPVDDDISDGEEELHVFVISDLKEELHSLRQSPDIPNICLTCVEERTNSTYSRHLNPINDVEKRFIHNGDSKNITGEQRHDDSSGGGGGGSYPIDANLNHKYMTDWIWNYFSADSGPSDGNIITHSSRSPLYFQHQGHSRTIVGIERCKKKGSSKEEDYLIVLDPSQRTMDIRESLKRKQGWQELVEREMHSLNQAEYQLCYIEPGIAKGEELESLKTLSSVRYMY